MKDTITIAFKGWGIYKKEDLKKIKVDQDDSTATAAVGYFREKNECLEYLRLKKEAVLFATGSHQEAERLWGEDKFSIERTAVMSLEETVRVYSNRFSNWF